MRLTWSMVMNYEGGAIMVKVLVKNVNIMKCPRCKEEFFLGLRCSCKELGIIQFTGKTRDYISYKQG